MNDILGIAIQHHLYIFPFAFAGLWLLSRWGAEPKRNTGRGKEAVGRAKVPRARDSRQPTKGQDGMPIAHSEMKERFDLLAVQQAQLEQRIAALNRPEAEGSRSGGKRKRKR